MAKDIWYLKHRPTTLDDYIFQSERDEKIIKKYIKDGIIKHLILAGHRGTGKTSLVYLLKNELKVDDVDFISLNASDETSIDTIRGKIKNFMKPMPLGEFKIIHLDEADRLSPHAQDALKAIMEEEASESRFILTTNKQHNIIPELKSRCDVFNFKVLNKDSMLEKFAVILQKEKVKIKNIEQLEQYVNYAYPDMRKLINVAQKNTIDGKLLDLPDFDNDVDEETFVNILYMVENNTVLSNDKREITYGLSEEECNGMYKMFIDHVDEIFTTLMGKKKAIVTIVDHMYRQTFTGFKQATFESCLISLSDIFIEDKKHGKKKST